MKVCPLCVGDKLEDCPECKGSGEWERREMVDLFEMQAWTDVLIYADRARNVNEWPSPGGIGSQTQWFVEVVRFTARIAERERELERERIEREARQRARRAKS